MGVAEIVSIPLMLLTMVLKSIHEASEVTYLRKVVLMHLFGERMFRRNEHIFEKTWLRR